MNKASNKPSTPNNKTDNPYEDMYGKPISKEKAAEIHFNLVNFVETLIAMDRQKQEWDKNKKQQTKKEA